MSEWERTLTFRKTTISLPPEQKWNECQELPFSKLKIKPKKKQVAFVTEQKKNERKQAKKSTNKAKPTTSKKRVNFFFSTKSIEDKKNWHFSVVTTRRQNLIRSVYLHIKGFFYFQNPVTVLWKKGFFLSPTSD